jgi:lysophospholipid acyltransferase (LPLAT)-like uncharacterized protein
MRIRHPILIKTLGLAAACAFCHWMGTLRYRYCPLGCDVNPRRKDLKQRYIYAIWHENILLPVYQYSRENIWVIVSQHTDGTLLTEMGRHLRLKLVRGSTTRGGVEGLRKLLRIGRNFSVAITPDGPRGPRRQVQPGLVYLAARTGMPIVPTAFGYERPWRLPSWDRFAIPKPWTLATCVTGNPLVVPDQAGRPEIEHYRRLVEERLLHASEVAEAWAESGRFHPDGRRSCGSEAPEAIDPSQVIIPQAS